MKVLLFPIGTRGDVEPLVALGEGLRLQGHDVSFCIPENFSSWMEELGFPYTVALGDLGAITSRTIATFREMIRELPNSFRIAAEAADGADLVVGSGIQGIAPTVCEFHRIPYVFASFSPPLLYSQEHFPVLGFSTPPLVNRLIWAEQRFFWNLGLRKTVNRQRAHLGLEKIRDIHRYMFHSGHMLVAADSGIVDLPADVNAVTPKGVDVTGFWLRKDDPALSDEVEDFLSGPPVIYAGFGSNILSKPSRKTRALIEAAAQLNCRLLIGSGWTGLGSGDLPAHCKAVEDISFRKLFPRLACAIHHGGAGTLAAGLYAGIPQILAPGFGDQFYWANKAHKLGLIPRPLYPGTFSAKRLVKALKQALNDESIRAKTLEASRAVQASNGVDRAITVLHQQVGVTGDSHVDGTHSALVNSTAS